MTDIFKCKKSGTICCAPKSRIHEMQMMHRNDTFPQYIGPQAPQYPNPYPGQNYQIPPNTYPQIQNPYQPVAPNYPVPANAYYAQPQPQPQPQLQPVPQPQQIIPQQAIYPVAPQNYPVPVPQNVYNQIAPVTPGNLQILNEFYKLIFKYIFFCSL